MKCELYGKNVVVEEEDVQLTLSHASHHPPIQDCRSPKARLECCVLPAKGFCQEHEGSLKKVA
jgi:hypothetical protein